MKTAESLIGKVNKLETVMASMQQMQAQNGQSAHEGSLEARMDHLERRLRRLNMKKADSSTAANDGGNAATLKSLTHTLHDAMKVATGQSENLHLPDYFHKLDVTQKKRHLMEEQSKLEDELTDLK